MNDKDLIKKIVSEEIKEIKLIHHGISNTNYLVNNKYVVRIKRSNDPFYSCQNEKEILDKIARSYLNDTTIYLDKDGNKVSKFIPHCTIFKGKKEEIIKTAKMLKILHNYPIKTKIKFNPFLRYQYYKKMAKIQNNFSHEISILKKTRALYKKYNLVFCHNDVVDNNLLFTKKRSYLIDYEFAGKNIYLFDLASFISENNINNQKKVKLFLSTYGFDFSNQKDLSTMIMFLNLFWYYWALTKFHKTHNKIFYDIAKIKKSHINENMREFNQ